MNTVSLSPGVTLRCYKDTRFKQSCLGIQFLRPMCRQEVSANALLPAVLMRGTAQAPDLRQITQRLDDLYGASIGAQVRRIGDCQTTGIICGFMEDRFAFGGDRILEPLIAFMEEMLLDPLLEDGAFCKAYVESEKANLISAIQSQKNDKRAYAMSQMLKIMCRDDSFGIPRLGDIPQVEPITAQSLYAHYQKVLRESPVHIFYVGSARPEQVAELLAPLAARIAQNAGPAPEQTGLHLGAPEEKTELMAVTQGKLCMGYATEITNRDPRFAAMQMLSCILGAGMTSKLFMNIREKQSLCYDIGSAYTGSKGLLTVSAGIDFQQESRVKAQIAKELEDCCQGRISQEEMTAARQMLLSQLEAVHDSPGAIESYYAVSAVSGSFRTPEQYRQQVEAVTREQVARAARTLRLHTVYFLKGE